MNIGEYPNSRVLTVSISLSEEKPAIMTRVHCTPLPPPAVEGKEQPKAAQPFIATHIIRLNNVDSTRIGFDELRSAFPQELGTLNDEDLLAFLIAKTSTIEGKRVTVGIEPQTKAGVVQKGPNGQVYYNVRLRSSVRNLDEATAKSMAARLLTGLNLRKQVAKTFDEAEEEHQHAEQPTA